ncbi:MAG: hypothetical protein H7249_02180 [Chitinophagaceae bacterium]|nr:hypothetical protein [Oligoflexus sp.]
MGKLIQLDRYKGLRQHEYLKRYDSQISKFVDSFLAQNLRVSYESLSYYFISAQQQEQQAAAWDYVDFRDTLRDGFHEAFGKELVRLCETQYWYDERFITSDELVERCVSQIILGTDRSAVR